METAHLNLLQQIPTTILSDIDAAEDRQIIERYREARDHGENPDDAAYIAAMRRRFRILREKLKAAYAGGNYHATPETLARMAAILNAGREASRARLASIRPQISSKPTEAVSQLSIGRPSVERPELTDEDISKLSDEELDRLIQEEESRE